MWATVEQVASVALGKMLDKNKHREGQLRQYLRNINVRWGWIDTADLLQMYFLPTEAERFLVERGDLLVCEGGEPGRAAVWDGRLPGMMYQKALHRVRLHASLPASYLLCYLEHMAKSGKLESRFTGSTVKHFTLESFVALPFPLPPLSEQRRIVAEMECRLDRVTQITETVDTDLKRAVRLRQAVLQKAFRGAAALTGVE